MDLMNLRLQHEQFPQQSLADTLGPMVLHPSGIANSSAVVIMRQVFNTKASKMMSSIYHRIALRELAIWLEIGPNS